MELIFDLNVLLRRDSEWDDTNAKSLLKFAEQHKFKIGWQLGNGNEIYYNTHYIKHHFY
jgi:hypothetical protein